MDCRPEEREPGWPNGQLPDLRELQREGKPRAEEEHKEAADQEEEDVEVEYNEVGAWQLPQKKGKELGVSEEMGSRGTGEWMWDLGIAGGRSRPWKAVQAEAEAACGSLGWMMWEPGRLWESWGGWERLECPPSLELTEACLGKAWLWKKARMRKWECVPALYWAHQQ